MAIEKRSFFFLGGNPCVCTSATQSMEHGDRFFFYFNLRLGIFFYILFIYQEWRVARRSGGGCWIDKNVTKAAWNYEFLGDREFWTKTRMVGEKLWHMIRFEARAKSFHTHPASCDSRFFNYYAAYFYFFFWWLKYFITLVIYNDDKMLYSNYSLLPSDGATREDSPRNTWQHNQVMTGYNVFSFFFCFITKFTALLYFTLIL